MILSVLPGKLEFRFPEDVVFPCVWQIYGDIPRHCNEIRHFLWDEHKQNIFFFRFLYYFIVIKMKDDLASKTYTERLP